jgi:Zn-dependent protease
VDRSLILRFLVTLPLLLVSLAAHEYAHGVAADRLGDPTPRSMGRLTLNPLRHLDVMGTLVLVGTFLSQAGFFFGWAKPVQVDQHRFADPQRGMVLVGAAGPFANLVLAAVASALVWLTIDAWPWVGQAFALAFVLNVLLALIHLVPVPPLDGSRVVGGLVPRAWYGRWAGLDRYGTWVFLVLLVVLVTRPEVFEATVGAVLDFAMDAFLPGEWI